MGLARSQNYLFVKVGTCPLFAHSQMLLGLATSSADNAGRRQTPCTKRTVKGSALVFRLRA